MRYIRKFIIASVVSAVMWVGCSSPSQEAEPVVKDCEAEYAEVCETPFTTTTAAIKRMDDYLADFGQENCAHVDDVKRMKELFEKMDLFFNNKQYDSYYEYLTKSQQVEEWFLNSGYRSVRATWLQLYEKDKQAMLENAIIDITAESFVENMKEGGAHSAGRGVRKRPFKVGYYIGRYCANRDAHAPFRPSRQAVQSVVPSAYLGASGLAFRLRQGLFAFTTPLLRFGHFGVSVGRLCHHRAEWEHAAVQLTPNRPI